MKSIEIKKIIMKHNQYASAVMNTTYQTRENTLNNYKNYIENEATIKELMSDVFEASHDAPDLFRETDDSLEIMSDSDEIKDKAILYKHLCFMVNDKRELCNYALSIYWRERKCNSAIRKLLEISMKPLIEYIQLKLNDMLLEAEDEEKQSISTIHNGDNFYGDNNQKVENGIAQMRDVGNDKSHKKFYFQKESFWMGVLSAVIAGLVVFGIEELVRYLIG